MQADLVRLVRASCEPQKLVALQGAPLPIALARERIGAMPQSFPIIGNVRSCEVVQPRTRRAVFLVQGTTLIWMLGECAISLYAAKLARSVVLLAFGADSFIEMLSAGVALASYLPFSPFTKDAASRWAGVLLFALAAVIAVLAVTSFVLHNRPEASCTGIGITIAALIVMPLLAGCKRKLAEATDNRALAADAVQSATCAYLATITLVGLALNAAFRIRWVDSMAALAVIPILVIEARRAMRGESCVCC